LKLSKYSGSKVNLYLCCHEGMEGIKCILPLIRSFGIRIDSVEWSTHSPAALLLVNTFQLPMNRRMIWPQSSSCCLRDEKVILLLPVFQPQTVQSVATHNTACTPHLKYLSSAQYLDDISLWSPFSYSFSVALSVGVADCYYRESSFVFRWGRRTEILLSAT
jgi:hypothetical protein